VARSTRPRGFVHGLHRVLERKGVTRMFFPRWRRLLKAARRPVRALVRPQQRGQGFCPSLECLETRELLANQLLPQIVPLADPSRGFLYDYVVDRTTMPGRTLLRFTTATENVGAGPLELRGGAINPDKTQTVYQRIYDDAGGYTDVLAGTFVYNEYDNRLHFQDYAQYNLLAVTPGGGVGNVVGTGNKVSFCLEDDLSYNLGLQGAPQNAVYTGFGQIQGVSIGWTDIYDLSDDDQWIDVTGVPNGQYWLQVTVDPGLHLVEANGTNSTARILINLNTQNPTYPPDAFQPNNFFSQAANLGTVTGSTTLNNLSINAPNNDDYFHFTAAAAGSLSANLTYTAGMGPVQLYLYDANQQLIASSTSVLGNTQSLTLPVSAGNDYYIRAAGYGGATNPNYSLTINAPTGTTTPGGDPTTAQQLGVLNGSRSYQGFVGSSHPNDYYQVTQVNFGKFIANMSGLAANANLQVLDSRGNVLANSTNSGTTAESVSVSLSPGSYYLRVYQVSGDTNYNLLVAQDFAGNTRATATDLHALTGMQMLSGYLGTGNTDDFYKLSLTSVGTIMLGLSGLPGGSGLQLLNSSGAVLANATNPGSANQTLNQLLTAGTYYVHVYQTGSGTNYTLMASTNYAGNTLASARQIGALTGNLNLAGYVGSLISDNFYEVVLTSAGYLSVGLTGLTGGAFLQIIKDANNNLVIDPGEVVTTAANLGTVGQSIMGLPLAAGEYYVRVCSAGGEANYNLGITTDYAGQTLAAARNAGTLTTTQIFNGFVNGDASKVDCYNGVNSQDYYSFTLKAPTTVGLGLGGLTADADLQLLNSSGAVLATSQNAFSEAETIIQALPAGTYYARVYHFLGATNYNLYVIPGASPNSSISFRAFNSALVYGQPAVLQATVTAITPGLGPPSGTITFMEGTTVLGSATISAGGTTLLTAPLALGTHSIKAIYSGDSAFAAATSSTITVTVGKARTTTALIAVSNPSAWGAPITITATVSALAPGSGTPTGTVMFKDGQTVLGSAPLVGGSASFTTTSILSVGSHSLTVSYSGDVNFSASGSSSLSEVVTKGSAVVTLNSSVAATTYGQAITFTATVGALAPAPGNPTGTVTFFDGSTSLGRVTLASGVATLTTALLAAGTHSITVVYAGDNNFAPNTSAAVIESIGQASSTLVLTSSAGNAVVGQSITLTATASPVSPLVGTPTGTVTFLDGTMVLGIVALSNRVARLTTTAFALGSHSLSAVYSADSNFTASTSATITQKVNKAGTTTTVVSSLNPAVSGQSITLTATVKVAAPGAGAPTGTVTFKDGSTVLAIVPLNGASAALTITPGTGTHNYTAAYSGDTNFATSTSAALAQTMQAVTTTTVTSSTGTSVFGQAVTLQAALNIVGTGSGSPTGTVTFMDGAAILGTATLTNRAASLTISTLVAGTHNITAVYSGDKNFAGSTSGPLNQAVSQANTAAALSSTTSTSVSGQAVIFTATVGITGPGAGTPTGTVTFSVDGVAQAPVSLNASGQARISLAGLGVGTHGVSFTYSGDSNFLGSTSNSTTLTVDQATSTTSVTAQTSADGSSVLYTITISAVAPGAGIPTGTVSIMAGGTTVLGSGTLSNGTAQVSIPTPSVDGQALTIVYGGDGSFSGTQSAVSTQATNSAGTTVAVAWLTNSNSGGAAVSFAASVNRALSNGASTPSSPTGTVTFMDGNTVLGTGTLSGGIVQFATPLASGTHTIQVIYSGDATYSMNNLLTFSLTI
jgi:hypothetical protein